MNAPVNQGGEQSKLVEELTETWGSSITSAAERIRWIASQQQGNLVATTSFGAQAAVMLHLLKENAPEIPIVFIDTGYLFPETYQFAEQLIKTWDLNIRVYQPEYSARRLEALYGKLWEQGEKGLEKYGLMTKVEPLNRALQAIGASVWLSGLRRSQSKTRSDRPFAEQQRRPSRSTRSSIGAMRMSVTMWNATSYPITRWWRRGTFPLVIGTPANRWRMG